MSYQGKGTAALQVLQWDGTSWVASASSGGGGAGDSLAKYLVLDATSSLLNERVFTPGNGLTGSDAGPGGAYTLATADNIVAHLTGAKFTGEITGTAGITVTGSTINLTRGGSRFFIDYNGQDMDIQSDGLMTIQGGEGEIFMDSDTKVHLDSEILEMTGTARVDIEGGIPGATAPINVSGSHVDFNSIPLKSASFIEIASVGNSPATSGSLRLDDGFSFVMRNSTNNGERGVLNANGSDDLVLGGGPLAPGTIDISCGTSRFIFGGSEYVRLDTTQLRMRAPTLHFLSTVPGTLTQQDDATASATGDPLTIRAQTMTGGGGTIGGDLHLLPGQGNTGGNVELQNASGSAMVLITGDVDGQVALQDGLGASIVNVLSASLGFYSTAPINKPTVTGSKAASDDVAIGILNALNALGLLEDQTS